MTTKTLTLLVLLNTLAACNFESSTKVNASHSTSVGTSSAVSDDKLFKEGEAKEGCTTEEDLEAQIEKAAKAEAPSLQGATDPGCEVK